MSQRPLLLAVGGVLGVSLGACVLNTVGLSSTSSEGAGGGTTSVTSGVPTTGAGGATGVTTAAETSATAQSSASAGGAATSSASSSASSSSASSSSASSSSASSAAASSSSASSSSGGGVTCDQQYGNVMEYDLCKLDAGFCEFNIKFTNEKTCRTVCTKRGGECEATYDTSASCVYDTLNKGCDFTMFNDAVCRCSLGCGNGPPCDANKVCILGLCTP
ncbi:MAG: hypothetical protein ABI134_35060 [Byssovorax sp.]